MSHSIDFYIGRMNDESLVDALSDFEDPLDGRSADLLSSLDSDEEYVDEDDYIDFEDY
jgi:hypothetical protein